MTTLDIMRRAKAAAPALARADSETKNKALLAMADRLEAACDTILAANALDVAASRGQISEVMLDRLTLTKQRIYDMAEGVRQVAKLPDPVGQVRRQVDRPNGLVIRRVGVPLGVVAIIYESRPNVTVDAFCLAYKSGNAILLRGSSSAYNSNKAIVEIIKEALENTQNGVPSAIELVETDGKSHDDVQQILTAVGKIDVVLPRGGAKLIQNVVSNAKVPVIETGSGVCHLYVDEFADLEMAVNIAENGKIQRPSVCNALECILVNKKIYKEFLPMMEKRFAGRVKIKADELSYDVLSNCSANADFIQKACDEDFGFEFLDYACVVKVVDSIDDAIFYINNHNTKHSESIITNDRNNARLFQAKVDASCVYVNCSTRFTDGGEFGFGAELGISTQKLHARGPMGIKALTTTKYLIDGEGQIR